ncbi:helix-turn-helix domain-containing protein [Aeromicrobium sp. UC242_57]|uniref:helix-turn-helix domain-containing protein n=1 Tax=Aeromicrobium sp. UC242_57 TaxID=3374624 RepID=UPI003792DD4C
MENSLKRRMGHNIRRIRRARGLSQEGLAEQLGFSRSFAQALDSGRKNVSLDKLEEYASKLGVDPLELLQEPADADLDPVADK